MFTPQLWSRYAIVHPQSGASRGIQTVMEALATSIDPNEVTAVHRYLTGLREAVYAGHTENALQLLNEVLDP